MPQKSNKRKSEKYYQDKRARNARRKAAAEMKSSLAWGPQIKETDLLSFQSLHFGDKSQPISWFVDATTALSFKQQHEEEEDDLGYYEDGVKRTLTDEEIAHFRRLELQQMEKQATLRQKDKPSMISESASALEYSTVPLSMTTTSVNKGTTGSGAKALVPQEAAVIERPSPSNQTNSESRSISHQEAAQNTSGWKERRSRFEVPYELRNKRNWEQYVESTDEIEGALTHRRMARELDDRATETFELDY